LDDGKVIGGKLVVACRGPTTLPDPIEEPLDAVAGAVEITAESRSAFWWDVGPCAFLDGKLSDPVRVVACSLVADICAPVPREAGHAGSSSPLGLDLELHWNKPYPISAPSAGAVDWINPP
jgi:hypothetical protein